MLRYSTIVAAVLICSTTSQARTISGCVMSEADSTAIVGASCRLMSGTQFINGSVTDYNGAFSVSSVPSTGITLEISMTGYNPAEIVIAPGKDINVGDIYLSDAAILGEVEVTAQTMTDIKGRTVIFPSENELKASSTAISLFQKLPLAGLEANPINRSLSVDGGSPVILINGIPSTIDDFNALQPKDIVKIEFSRIAPARYADRGNKGFISITLRKRHDGGQVYIYGRSAVSTAFVDGNVRSSYHQGPSQFTLTYNPTWRNYQKVYDNTVESFIGDDFRVDLEEHDRNPFSYHGHNVGLKYDFSPNTATIFSATFRVSPYWRKSRSLASTSDSYLGDYDNRNIVQEKSLAPSLDLFFKRDFNESNNIEVEVVGTLSSSDYRRNNDYTFADGTSDQYIMDVDSRRRSLISEVSYTHQFGQNTSLSAGYQNTISRSTNTYLSSDYKPVLTENNNYLYARLGQQIGPVYLSLSSGAKMYWIKNDLNRRHFIRNISTVQLSWNVTPKWDIAAAFQYTPTIPSLSSLTDYPQQTSPYLISNGNPDLKVAQRFIYQAMPTFRHRKFSASLLMTYSNINDFVMSDISYIGDGMFLSQSINARRSWYAGGNLNLKISDIHGFGANVSVGLDHYETMGEQWCHTLTSVDASFTLWWNNGPFTISYWRKVPGKYLSGNSVWKEENGDALSFEYQPDKHWTIGASWMYMFDVKGTKYPRWGYSATNPLYLERYIKNNANMVVLSATYSADFGSLFRTSRRSLNNSDNGSSLLKM